VGSYVSGRQVCSLVLKKSEILPGVSIADIADQAADEFVVIGDKSVPHVVTEDIAEEAAEILVARVGNEGPAVGQHADKLAEQAQLG
jgi:hypothetical protein